MSTKKIVISVITYKRPGGLTLLLESLAAQRYTRTARPVLEVIVVDNDAAESARTACDDARSRLGLQLTYLVEPLQGIPCARNAGLRAMPADADYIALIDDDEIASEYWLDELLACLAETKAECVAGPVLPDFPEGVEPWVVKGRFFEERKERDRSEIDKCGTGNVLFCARAWRPIGLLFDMRLRFTGSSDSLFFITAKRAGWRIVWATTAKVFERVPASRCTARWIIERQFRTGVSLTLCAILAHGWWRAFPVRSAKSGVFVLWGLLDLVGAVAGGKAFAVRGVAKIARGIGGFTAVFGYRFEAYRPERLVPEQAVL